MDTIVNKSNKLDIELRLLGMYNYTANPYDAELLQEAILYIGKLRLDIAKMKSGKKGKNGLKLDSMRWKNGTNKEVTNR